MKTIIKTLFVAIAISVSAASCSGDRSSNQHDSTGMDSSGMKDTSQTGRAPGANGSPAAIDSGMDNSGSGGVDTMKKP